MAKAAPAVVTRVAAPVIGVNEKALLRVLRYSTFCFAPGKVPAGNPATTCTGVPGLTEGRL